MISTLLDGLKNAGLMAYEVWEGNRYESTAREVIRQEAASLSRA